MDKTLDNIIKKHVILTCLTALAVICMMITITYGLYQTNHKNTVDQEIAIGDFDVDLTSSSGQITLVDLNPGDTGNTSYTFTTSNSGDYTVAYSVYLTDNTTTFLSNSTNASTYSGYTQITEANYAYINYSLDGGVAKSLADVYDSATGKMTIITGRLQPGDTKSHTITFSISSDAPNSLQGSILALNITMDASASKETGADKIMKLVAGEPSNSTNVITKTAPSGATCTNTLAYDGTVDNNLRYVGANPCNYVTFNGESPSAGTKWAIVKLSDGAIIQVYETQSACQSAFVKAGSPEGYECQSKTLTTGGWRIVGIMNNVDDGTGNLETRIKLIRNAALGEFSWDSSASGVNYGSGVNDWTQADLKNELNGDYLNTSLNANTNWYNGKNNQKTGVFDYTKRLSTSAQNLIGDAKWYLGGIDDGISGEGMITTTMYTKERGTEVWGSKASQTCNDGACPRATSWTGKVALIYPSDFGFATVGGTTTNRNSCIGMVSTAFWMEWDDDSDCYLNNWISYQWTLSPRSYDAHFVGLANPIFDYNLFTFCDHPVRPAVYLRSGVRISGGNGTESNPYILAD